MMICFGWAVVQAFHERYVGLAFDETDKADGEIEAENKRIRADCRSWLETNGATWLKWQFAEQLNNHGGMLQFMTSRNHRTSSVWELMEFLASQSKGTHGLVYLRDDEDSAHASSFGAWRILDGSVTEHDDPHFSPLSSVHAFGDEIGAESL